MKPAETQSTASTRHRTLCMQQHTPRLRLSQCKSHSAQDSIHQHALKQDFIFFLEIFCTQSRNRLLCSTSSIFQYGSAFDENYTLFKNFNKMQDLPISAQSIYGSARPQSQTPVSLFKRVHHPSWWLDRCYIISSMSRDCC